MAPKSRRAPMVGPYEKIQKLAASAAKDHDVVTARLQVCEEELATTKQQLEQAHEQLKQEQARMVEDMKKAEEGLKETAAELRKSQAALLDLQVSCRVLANLHCERTPLTRIHFGRDRQAVVRRWTS